MQAVIKFIKTVSLLIVLSAIASCNGQSEIEAKQAMPVAGQTNILLPQGVSPHTMFRCSFKDNNNNIWFGTTGAGVYKYDGKLFARYAEKEGLLNGLVYSVAQDKNGNIWVATGNGLFYSEGNVFNQLQVLLPQHSGNSFSASSSGQNLIVYCVLCDSKGNIWFGTEDQGLWRYDGKDFINYRCADSTWAMVPAGQAASYPQKGFVQCLLEDKSGNIWFSSFATSVNYFDGNSFHQVNVDHLKDAPYKRKGNNISTCAALQMVTGKDGNIWMATRDDGICRYNGKTVESYIGKDGFNGNSASCIYQAKNGNIFFGSLGTLRGGERGIGFYNGKTFTSIAAEGLRNNEVWTVIEDGSGFLWVGTKEFGLFRYDGKTFTEFTKQ